MQGKVFLVGIFFQTSLNLFICDMRKWKKNKNIRRRVLFLSNLESISQFGKKLSTYGTIIDIGIVACVSTVRLTFQGIASNELLEKQEEKCFS